MSKEKKNGRRFGLLYEIIVLALLMGLSMMLGIRLYCREWADACSNAIWIACWVVWYKIWKDAMRYRKENIHLKGLVASAVVGLGIVKHAVEEENDGKGGDGAEAGAQENQAQNPADKEN